MRRLLIVNADDLGLHEDINRGIYLAHTHGIVTSASLVACGEAFTHATQIIHQCPDLDVGVHLTLVGEQPLSSPDKIPSLVGRDGRFAATYRRFMARVIMGLVSPAEIHRELEAQIERVTSSVHRPSHLDSHQHVHLLPAVWRVTQDLARQHQIRWIRVPYFHSLVGSRRTLLDPFFRLGLNLLSAATANSLNGAAARIRTTGLHLSGKLTDHDLSRLIIDLQPGISEIVAHPGVSTPALSARYRWNYEWSTELAALTSPSNVSLLRSNEISLIRFLDC